MLFQIFWDFFPNKVRIKKQCTVESNKAKLLKEAHEKSKYKKENLNIFKKEIQVICRR